MKTARDMESILEGVLEDDEGHRMKVDGNFVDHGFLTHDRGLVVRLPSGEKFQLIIKELN